MKRTLLALTLAAGLVLGIVNADGHGSMPATVVDIATSSDDFSILVQAVVAADLVGALSSEGPFTVFAPTNDAFAAALEALGITAGELLASEGLAGILTYHVVAGKLMAADVLAAIEANGGTVQVETLNGASITVTLSDGSVMVDGAKVVITDLEAGNGVVHVIDAVILPPSE
jgi:transforming growth factor-beta-induced protein